MTEPENPYETLTKISEPPKPSRRWKSTLFELLTVAGIIAMLLALMLPAFRQARRPLRAECMSNLKCISIALHNYASHNQGNFPPAYTVDSAGKPLHSWRTLILPYADYREIYEQIDLSKPWNDPVNAEAFKARVRVYNCPSTDLPSNLTTYLAILTPNSWFRATESKNLSDFADRQLETIMVIDMGEDRAVPWMSPKDTDEQSVLDLGSKLKTSHPGGTNVAWVDGSVGYFDTSTSADERRAMISITGNDAEVRGTK